jgi:hypothetical protein
VNVVHVTNVQIVSTATTIGIDEMVRGQSLGHRHNRGFTQHAEAQHQNNIRTARGMRPNSRGQRKGWLLRTNIKWLGLKHTPAVTLVEGLELNDRRVILPTFDGSLHIGNKIWNGVVGSPSVFLYHVLED